METFSQLGYFGLLISSFLAATILPLSSEIVLSVLLLNEFDPVNLLIIATIGNVLGALTNYVVGYWGRKIAVQNLLKISKANLEKAEKTFRKYGLFSLFFAWVPVIGDPLTMVAGLIRVNILWFFILVVSGKLIRYVVVIYTTLQLQN